MAGAFNVTAAAGLPKCDVGDTEETAVLVSDNDFSEFDLDRTSSDNAILQGESVT